MLAGLGRQRRQAMTIGNEHHVPIVRFLPFSLSCNQLGKKNLVFRPVEVVAWRDGIALKPIGERAALPPGLRSFWTRGTGAYHNHSTGPGHCCFGAESATGRREPGKGRPDMIRSCSANRA